MRLLPLLLLPFFSAALSAAPPADPSTQPLKNGDGTYSERWRIVVDLDGDEQDDLILSGDEGEFGNGGGPWTVYLRRGEKLKTVGPIFAHWGAISIEADRSRNQKDLKDRRFARIWVYGHAGASTGRFGYYRIGETKVEDLAKLELYSGGSGEDSEVDLGSAIYQATFEKSPIPFSVEHSSTDEQGHVTWAETK